MSNRTFPASFVAILALLFLQLSALHMFTGYADNGDFARSIGLFFEKPAGFSVMWPTAGGDEWNRRFFTQWHDGWVVLSDWPAAWSVYGDSSYKLYLAVQISMQRLFFSSSSDYSVIAGSVLSRTIFCASIVWLLFIVRKMLPAGIYCVFVAIILIFALDGSWTAFFNSFFEEQIAIIFMPVLAAFLVLLYRDRKGRYGVFFLLCATFVGAAKTAYFYLPILSALFALPILIGRFGFARFFVMVLCCQLIAAAPVYFGKYGSVNSYHALYYGVLKAAPASEIVNEDIVGGVVSECIGVSAFEPAGARCLDKANATYLDLAGIVVAHPMMLLRMIPMEISEGRDVGLDYLGRKISGSPEFSDLKIFNLGETAFKHGFSVFVFGLFSVVLLLLVSRKLEAGSPLPLVGVFFAVFGFSQYLVALGDGFYELSKHLTAGNYALAFSSAFMVPSILCFLFAFDWRRAET